MRVSKMIRMLLRDVTRCSMHAAVLSGTTTSTWSGHRGKMESESKVKVKGDDKDGNVLVIDQSQSIVTSKHKLIEYCRIFRSGCYFCRSSNQEQTGPRDEGRPFNQGIQAIGFAYVRNEWMRLPCRVPAVFSSSCRARPRYLQMA